MSEPTISSCEPLSGPLPLDLIIRGSGLAQTLSVAVGASQVPYDVQDDGRITCHLPISLGLTPGLSDVTVQTPGGEAILVDAFLVLSAQMSWQPTQAQVAALERARTKLPSGGEQGFFSDQTRPTSAEVDELISQACAKVASYVGWLLPAAAWAEASSLAALYTAILIEASYYPEQIGSDRSAWSPYWEMFQANIRQLQEFVGSFATAIGIGRTQGTLSTPSATVVDAYRYGYAGIGGLSDIVNVGLGAARRG